MQQKTAAPQSPTDADVVVNGGCYQGFLPDASQTPDCGAYDGGASDAQSADGSIGRLDKDDIRRVVRNHVYEVKRCYEDGLRRDATLAGRELFHWTIGPAGTVLSSHLSTSEINDMQIATCIGRRICEWRFPRPMGGGVVKVAYPFLLQPGPPLADPPPEPELPALPVDPALFRAFRSPHLLVHSDAHQDAVQEVVQRLEEIYMAITTTMLAAEDDFPIELILFASDWDFHKLSPVRVGGVFVHARNRGVIMMPYKQGGHEWGAAGQRIDYLAVAVHEMVHRLIDDGLPLAPSWFHEGLASFLETAFVRDGHVWYGVPGAPIFATLKQAPILPLREFLVSGPVKHNHTDARYYATAWLLIDYLMVGNPGERGHRYGKLWRQLRENSKREDWPGLLVDVFDGKHLGVIEAELQKHSDVMIVGRPQALRLKKVPVTAFAPVRLRERVSDPDFVARACRVLQSSRHD